MAIKFESFKGGTGASTDTLDDVTSRGASTTNSITVGGVTVGTEYSLPSADGSPNEYLKTNGSGVLSFGSLDITGGLTYQGSFNATTGSPSLANAEQGDFYLIDTAGTIYGKDWNIGDHLLINADMGGSITNSKIDKIDNTETTASTDVAGVIEIATDAEAQTATATDKALVPSNISSIALSSFNDDLSYLSSGDNVSELTNDAGYLTTVASASTTAEGIIEIATDAEAQTATATDKALVPSNISSIDLSSFNNDLSFLSSGDNVSLLINDANYLVNISEDSTPQLGGNLDVNGQSITSASNGNVTINPDGTGDISIGADLIPDADATHTIGDEDNRYISYYGDMNGAIRFKAKNNQGAQIQKGQAVFISGVSGTVPEVQLARANSASTMPAFGLAFATANDQADIEIVTFGNLNSYNTTTYSLSANDTVFVSASTAGALTNSAPTGEGNLIQNIGRVVRADATEGIIKVGGAGRSNATPNLDDGKIFLGNASNQATSTAISTIALSSFNDDLSYLSSGDNVSELTNDAGYLTTVASASTTAEGIIEIATNAEAEATTATDKALVPSNISSIALSSFNDDLSYLSSGDNVSELTNDANYLVNVSEDSTPQLGGDLDTNTNELITASNRNLVLRPNGTGHVFLGGNTNPAEIRLYCQSGDSHHVGFKSPTHAELDSGSSTVWRLPVEDGSADQVLKTDGSGNLSFTTVSGGATAPTVTSDSPSGDVTITTTTGIEEIYLLTPSADITVNLPSASTAGSGYKYLIKNLSSSYILTVDANSTETIDNTETYDINIQYQSLSIVSDGSNWHII